LGADRLGAIMNNDDYTYTPMADVLPEGHIGEAQLKHLVIDEKAAKYTRLREVVTNGRDRAIPEGTYAQLYVNGVMMMSDTPMEQESNQSLLMLARGDVLIAGLGLGMILIPLLSKPEVRSVIVVEKSPDVIAIIEGPLREALGAARSAKLTIICADIFDYKPLKGQKWDTIFLDIWPSGVREDVVRPLRMKFSKRLNRPWGHMGYWTLPLAIWFRR
jgi:predicted membrane-bound spermidine synthase